MALFPAQQRRNMVLALQGDMRLLLPADPGRDQLIEYVHLFDPRARSATAGRIDVDNERDLHLTKGWAITPEVAAEAGVPPGITVAFFVQNTPRGIPFSTVPPINSK